MNTEKGASAEFTLLHRNREKFPSRSILVVEDDLSQQINIGTRLVKLFGGQGEVIVVFCPSAVDAASYLIGLRYFSSENGEFGMGYPRAIILDHDLQIGDGVQLLSFMRDVLRASIPVLTASGIPSNNDRLMQHGATHKFTKDQVICGDADQILLELVK